MFNVPNKVLVIVAHQDDEKIEIKTLRVLMRRYNV